MAAKIKIPKILLEIESFFFFQTAASLI